MAGSRAERHPVAVAVACLGAFLVVTSLPVAAWLEGAGLSAGGANAVHAGLLAALMLGAAAWYGLLDGGRVGLLVMAGVAAPAAFAGPVGAYLSWCAFTGVAEEVLLCGILYPCLRSCGGSERRAWLGAAALFAACHVTGTLPMGWAVARVLFAGAFAWAMIWLARRTGRLWVPALCHAAFDAVFFLLI